ncbi:MAG: hypothetical protein LW699_03235 [Pirellula sp.]|jgi:hypothetical protein|nr:hypothetical protein [Pirellula sp.]
MSEHRPILYCRCAYAKVLPEDVKDLVLERLIDSNVPFESVSDLCEMSARKDPGLVPLSQQAGLRIVACYPRAVKWLFSAAGAAIQTESGQSESGPSKSGESESRKSDAKEPVYIEVLNMRTDTADSVCAKLGIGTKDTAEGAQSQATGVSP